MKTAEEMARESWYAMADEANCWENLSQPERDTLITYFRSMETQTIKRCADIAEQAGLCHLSELEAADAILALIPTQD